MRRRLISAFGLTKKKSNTKLMNVQVLRIYQQRLTAFSPAIMMAG